MNRYNDVIEIGEILYSLIANNNNNNNMKMKILLLLSDCYIINKDIKALNCLYLCEYEKYSIGIYLMIKYICFTKTISFFINNNYYLFVLTFFFFTRWMRL